MTVLRVLLTISLIGYTAGDNSFLLTQQLDALQIFSKVHIPNYYRNFTNIADNFQFDEDWSRWKDATYAKKFWNIYSTTIIPTNEEFLDRDPEHLSQATALFNTFMYARNYETFRTIAIWARYNINTDLFVFALYSAYLQSEYTRHIILPLVCEIIPHRFFSIKVMQEAHKYWLNRAYKEYAIQVNYPNQSLTSYFTEDMELISNRYGINNQDTEIFIRHQLNSLKSLILDERNFNTSCEATSTTICQNKTPYEKEDLIFEGVTIGEVYIDPLRTFYENVSVDLSNGKNVNDIYLSPIKMNAKLLQLNNKPFKITININSDIVNISSAFVKVFIGSSNDFIEEHTDSFYEIDRFKINLSYGNNVIQRHSSQSLLFSNKFTFAQLYQQVQNAQNGEKFPMDENMKFGLPRKFMLPKGGAFGKIYTMVFIVVPYHESIKENDLYAKYFVDVTYNLRFPFDRPVKYGRTLNVPNFHFRYVRIYHS